MLSLNKQKFQMYLTYQILLKNESPYYTKANNIIEYRKKNKFNTINDIMNVSGISESLFNKIKEYIKV